MLYEDVEEGSDMTSLCFSIFSFVSPSSAAAKAAAVGHKTGSKSIPRRRSLGEELSSSECALKELQARDESHIDRERDRHKNR